MTNISIVDRLDKKIYKINNGIAIEGDSTSRHLPSPPGATATGALFGDLMHMPLSFWMLDKTCSTIAINQEGINICGFESEQSAIGKSLLHVSTKDSASPSTSRQDDGINVTRVRKSYD